MGSTSSFSEIPCRGNGKTTGFETIYLEDTHYVGLYLNSNVASAIATEPLYGTPIGTTPSGVTFASFSSIGVTTEAAYSGIVADISDIPTFQPYHYIKY